MALFYLDTSAIVKRYRSERGTELVDRLLDNTLPPGRFYTSFLSVLEITSAMLRLAKGGQMTEDVAAEILSRFRLDLQNQLRIWPLDDEVIRGAVRVIEEHRLRAPDAIHMATAKAIFSIVSGHEVIMVSSDKELLAAATTSGITPLSPEDAGSLERLTKLQADA